MKFKNIFKSKSFGFAESLSFDEKTRTFTILFELQYRSGNDTPPAELVQVCWLEVTGKAGAGSIAPGKYKIKFEVSKKEDAFGWNCPVYMIAKSGKKGRYSWKKIDVSTEVTTDKKELPPDFEIDVKATDDNTIYFGLYEVWSGKWKGGLKIHGAIVEGPPP